MKKLMIVIVVAIALVACNSKSTGKKFEVSGSIANNTAKKIYLEEIPPTSMQRMIVDSASIDKTGSFSLKTSSADQSIYNLRFDEEQFPVVSLINDAVTVKVNIDRNNKTETYTVEGSDASRKIKEVITGGTMKWTNLDRINLEMDSLKKINANDSLMDLLNKEGQAAFADMKEFVSSHLKNSGNPVFTLFTLGIFRNFFSLEEYGSELLNAENKFPGNKAIIAAKQMFDQQVAVLKERENTAGTSVVGKEAPEITMPDVNGNEVRLSSFRGKYVLVDFWASWCGPCRQENPNVVKAYNKFKDKNFTILGVSLDRPGEKDKWVKAIMDDNLTWKHVSDLMEWRSTVVALYNINGIPYNVLIDPKGKMIGENLFGIQLEEKLAEVLK